MVPKHFSPYWQGFVEDIQNKFVYLLLDFDGTLSPIAPTPADAALPVENRRLLEKLTKVDFCQVVLVSGRALTDLQRLVNIPGVTYIGNHGFEMSGADIQFESLVPPDLKNTFQDLVEEISKRLSKVQGLFIENKVISLSIHYRLVNPDELPVVYKVLKQICQPLAAQKKIKVFEGKEVVEIRPPVAWDKGAAVIWLLKKRQHVNQNKEAFPIFIGDDTTDEDAFTALKTTGLTILVGEPRETEANYYLQNTGEVTDLLQKILDAKKRATTYVKTSD